MKSDLTVMVVSYDGYSDIWPVFFSCMNKNWHDCPFDVRLVSNQKQYEGVNMINVGPETCWTERVLSALQKIDTEYVLLLLEDYLIGSPVHTDKVINVMDFIRTNHGRYVRLTNIPRSKFNDKDSIFPIYEDEEYAVNLQAAIWKTEFLVESLSRYSGNAWEFEIGFLRDAIQAEHKVMQGCFGLKSDPLYVHNGVLKGKWFRKEIKYFKKQGISVNWIERGRLSWVQELRFELALWIKDRMSYKWRKRIKCILKKLGMKFVSDL